MTRVGKTYKDLKERKDWARASHDAKEGERTERGGHKNIVREAQEEELEDLMSDLKEVEGILDES
jgi:hypothetical protein